MILSSEAAEHSRAEIRDYRGEGVLSALALALNSGCAVGPMHLWRRYTHHMFRAIAVLLLLTLAAQCQNRPTTKSPDEKQNAPAPRKGFFRSRRGLALLGGAIAGAGVTLLATSGRTRQVPAANCSFYPTPFVPCVAAHSEKTRSAVQDGLGGGLLVGGFVTVYAAMR